MGVGISRVQSCQVTSFAGMNEYYVQAGQEKCKMIILQKQKSIAKALYRTSTCSSNKK